MPEGHTVHRIANSFNELFAGKKLTVDSPQGRFTASAKLISNRKLTKAWAIGKQMFLDFDNDQTLRIHLGIYGKWRFVKLKNGELPEVQGQVRARFFTNKDMADLRGPTICELIEPEKLTKIENRLGPDPLNPDDGSQFKRFQKNISGSKAAIGLLLMNQDVVAGIGNVYRAEILYRARINPHVPGNLLTPKQIKELWKDSVQLLALGVIHGVMLTRDGFLDEDPGKPKRHHVYKRNGEPCRKCKTHILLEVMAGRKLYFCPNCQR
ncbi:MAG: Fpg/Nei family DNA glycosylase [Actinobacteria bacterium]|uniref:DNA-(apurinic or apyrimidinic site) lyase n=1 Tax=freshwater metagenome TaxID=449393 RepID=A0A6J6HST7_9ZZZZ|nr:Fpg/Nei family DNA glycosylase [Actinomycetota bacterium]